jgi:hypothetical protein
MRVLPGPKTKQQPRKGLEQSWVEVVDAESTDENLRRVANAAPASSMGIARVPEPREAVLDPGVRYGFGEFPTIRQRK